MNVRLKSAGKYLAAAAVIGINAFSSLFGMRPFGAGAFLAFACVACPYVYAPIFVLTSFAASPTPAAVIESVALAAVTCLTYFILSKKKRRFGVLAAVLCGVGGSLGKLYAVLNGSNVFFAAISALFTVGFAAGFAPFLKAAFYDRFKYKLLVTELSSGGLGLIALFGGLHALDLKYFFFSYAVLILIVSLGGAAGGAGAAVSVGVLSGLGLALTSGDINYVASAASIALAACTFSSLPRPLGASAAIMAEVVIAYFFGFDLIAAPYRLLSLAAGGLVYCLMPRVVVEWLTRGFGSDKSKAAVRCTVNRLRQSTGNEIRRVGETLREMSAIMSSSLKSEVVEPRKAAARIRAAACMGCPDLEKCIVTADENAFVTLATNNIQTGKISVGELPKVLSDGCSRLSRLIGASGELAASQAKFSESVRFENAAKLMLSEQLAGTSEIMTAFGVRASAPVGFEPKLEQRIAEDLTYGGVACGEALAAVSGEGIEAVTAVVRTDSFDGGVAQKIVSKTLGAPYRAEELVNGGVTGWSCATFVPCEKFEVVYGVAGCPKSAGAKSGDTHSFSKIAGGKFMTALCDGMGSGENAEKVSSAAISLVENFYRAGFDTELILKSVNTFLSSSGGESFTATDVVVIDLWSGDAEIVKIGTPPTFIKDKESVRTVCGSALPLGVLDEMRPSSYRVSLVGGESVIIVSDGVADCFDGESLYESVLTENGANPKTLAEGILSEALKRIGGSPRDDMTVICLRILKRV